MKIMEHSPACLFRNSLKNIIQCEKIIKRNIEDESFEKQFLWLSTRRFISHARAIIFLCNKKQNLEALMLLRPIIELVVNLRWVIEDNTGNNRKQFMESTEYTFNNSGIPQMGNYWSEKSLKDRMADIGFAEDYYETVVKKLHEEIHVNPAVIARAHNKNLTLMNHEAIFSVACQWAGHLLAAANKLYPNECFMDHRDVWSKIKIRVQQ